MKKTAKVTEAVTEVKTVSPVAEALEEVRAVVKRVKNVSYSDFEYLSDAIKRMLMQPERL